MRLTYLLTIFCKHEIIISINAIIIIIIIIQSGMKVIDNLNLLMLVHYITLHIYVVSDIKDVQYQERNSNNS